MMNAQLLCKLVKDFVTQPIVGREILVHNVKRGSEMRSSLSSDCIMITEVIVQRKYSQRYLGPQSKPQHILKKKKKKHMK